SAGPAVPLVVPAGQSVRSPSRPTRDSAPWLLRAIDPRARARSPALHTAQATRQGGPRPTLRGRRRPPRRRWTQPTGDPREAVPLAAAKGILPEQAPTR